MLLLSSMPLLQGDLEAERAELVQRHNQRVVQMKADFAEEVRPKQAAACPTICAFPATTSTLPAWAAVPPHALLVSGWKPMQGSQRLGW